MGELKISSPVHLQTNTSTANPALIQTKYSVPSEEKHKWSVRGGSEGSCSAGQTLPYIHCSCPDGHAWPIPPRASLAPKGRTKECQAPGSQCAPGAFPGRGNTGTAPCSGAGWQMPWTKPGCDMENAAPEAHRNWLRVHGPCWLHTNHSSTSEQAPISSIAEMFEFFWFLVFFFLNPGPCYAIINDSETPHQSVWTLEYLKSVS